MHMLMIYAALQRVKQNATILTVFINVLTQHGMKVSTEKAYWVAL